MLDLCYTWLRNQPNNFKQVIFFCLTYISNFLRASFITNAVQNIV